MKQPVLKYSTIDTLQSQTPSNDERQNDELQSDQRARRRANDDIEAAPFNEL
jgi:hypothetical protein